MEIPPLTRYYFSPKPGQERAIRWFCFLLVVIISLALYYYWVPLRDPEFTYSMVSVTVENLLVFLFFQFITTLGSEGFFLVFFSVIYWSFNKTLGFWGLIVMPLSVLVTSEIPKDIVRLPRPDVPGVVVPTYTFPSGHTSGAVSVWGFMAILLKKRWFWMFSLIIMFLVGLSRIMLGYHYPGDVLGGVVTGIVFLAMFFGVGLSILEKNWDKNLSFTLLLFIALALPIAMSFIPAYYAPRLTGYMAGAAAGYLLEKRNINFSNAGHWRQHFSKALLGMGVIALIIPGFDLFLPDEIQIINFIQHAFATFWITYLAPWLFIRLGLINAKHLNCMVK